MSAITVPPRVAPVVTPAAPVPVTLPLYRLSVELYHKMIDAGVFASDERVELIRGLLVKKTPKNAPHRISTHKAQVALSAVLPPGWHAQTQNPIQVAGSEPEPDLAVVRGRPEDYNPGHPAPPNVPLVVEIAESSLPIDRGEKRSLYAEAGIPVYWIVNLVDGVLEVYTDPHGAGEQADYATVQRLGPADPVTISLDGQQIGPIAVRDLLP